MKPRLSITPLILLSFLWIQALPAITPTKQVEPDYPGKLFDLGIEGKAVITVTIGRNGKPDQCSVDSATRPEFGAAALEAAKQWKFEPVVEEGKRVSKTVNIPFTFRVPLREEINEAFDWEVYSELEPDRPVVDLENILAEYRPQPKRRVMPRYPDSLKGSGKKGVVVLTYIVDEEGRVRNPMVRQATDDAFVMPALAAAIQTEWRPLLSRDEYVYQRVAQAFEFYEGMEDEQDANQPGNHDVEPVKKQKDKNGWGGWKFWKKNK